ncbi:hypothetical protein BpHYR1_021350, partial [Brachionus plicatilis]
NYILSIADISGNRTDDLYIQMRNYFYLIEKKVDTILLCFSLVDQTSYSNINKKSFNDFSKFKHFSDKINSEKKLMIIIKLLEEEENVEIFNANKFYKNFIFLLKVIYCFSISLFYIHLLKLWLPEIKKYYPN